MGTPECGHIVWLLSLWRETDHHQLQIEPSPLPVWMREVVICSKRLAWESGQ